MKFEWRYLHEKFKKMQRKKALRYERWKDKWPHHFEFDDDRWNLPQTLFRERRNWFNERSYGGHHITTEAFECWCDCNEIRWSQFGHTIGFLNENAAFAFKMRWM